MIETGLIIVKEIVKEPVKEAVREAIAESEAQTGHTGEESGHDSDERESGGRGWGWWTGAVLGLLALGVVSYYAKQRMGSKKSEKSKHTGDDAMTGTAGGVSDTGTTDPVSVNPGGGSDFDDTYSEESSFSHRDDEDHRIGE